jgi:hypothetical protein
MERICEPVVGMAQGTERGKLEELLQHAEEEAEVWHRNAAAYRRGDSKDLETALRCEIRAHEWECIADMLRETLDD